MRFELVILLVVMGLAGVQGDLTRSLGEETKSELMSERRKKSIWGNISFKPQNQS